MNQNVVATTTQCAKTGILVSVRDAMEAQIATRAGVDILDIKEPSHGSLGAADAQTINEILNVVPEETCISIALGELHEVLDRPQRIETVVSTLSDSLPIAFVKIGLSKMADRSCWSEYWAEILRKLPRSIETVGVIYADRAAAMSPPPTEIVQTAAALGCRAVLIDTYDKSSGNLLVHVSTRQLRQIQQLVYQHDMQIVLAGSINLDCLEKIGKLQPNFVGVRGAVCTDAVRTNSISVDAINNFKAHLHRTQLS